MTEPDGVDDDLRKVAARVADQLSYDGYAYVEDDRVDDLAVTLGRFLAEAGITVRAEPGDSDQWPGGRRDHIE
jgi:hypothetical protein